MLQAVILVAAVVAAAGIAPPSAIMALMQLLNGNAAR
jgi:hypothetical protein